MAGYIIYQPYCIGLMHVVFVLVVVMMEMIDIRNMVLVIWMYRDMVFVLVLLMVTLMSC